MFNEAKQSSCPSRKRCHRITVCLVVSERSKRTKRKVHILAGSASSHHSKSPSPPVALRTFTDSSHRAFTTSSCGSCIRQHAANWQTERHGQNIRSALRHFHLGRLVGPRVLARSDSCHPIFTINNTEVAVTRHPPKNLTDSVADTGDHNVANGTLQQMAQNNPLSTAKKVD